LERLYSIYRESFQADNFLTTFFGKLRPYGQPGQMPIGNVVALLIELKAQIL